MRRSFLFILFSFCVIFPLTVWGDGASADSLKQPVIAFDEHGRSENVISVEMRGNRLSGILIVKKEEGRYLGTLVNEFGIKAFDFVVTEVNNERLGGKKRVKLIDIVRFMDRGYIRRVLRRDIDFMLRFPNVPQGCKIEVVEEEGNVTVKDLRYGINYCFIKK